MELDKIKELAGLLEDSSLTRLRLEEDGTVLELEATPPQQVVTMAPPPSGMPPAGMPPAPSPTPAQPPAGAPVPPPPGAPVPAPVVSVPAAQVPSAVSGDTASGVGTAAAQAADSGDDDADAPYDMSKLTLVKAPMVGVFYAAPSPGADPFVRVGSKVKKGDTLCVMEAMKLMNEVTAERDGEVVDICVEDGDLVEFGGTLMKIY